MDDQSINNKESETMKTDSEELFQKLSKLLDDLQSRRQNEHKEKVENGTHNDEDAESLKFTNLQLKGQIEELKYELTKKNKMKEEIKALKEELQKQSEDMSETEKKLKAEIEALASKNGELISQVAVLEKDKETAITRCEQSEKLMTEKRTKVHELVDENDELREEIGKLENKNLQLDEEIAELELTVKNLEADKKVTEESNSTLHDQISKLQIEFDGFKAENNKNGSDGESSSTKTDELMKEKGELLDELAKLRTEIENSISSGKQRPSANNEEIGKLRSELEQEKQKVLDFEKTSKDLSTQLDDLAKQNGKYQELLEALTKDTENDKKRSTEDRIEIDKILAENEELKKRLQKALVGNQNDGGTDKALSRKSEQDSSDLETDSQVSNRSTESSTVDSELNTDNKQILSQTVFDAKLECGKEEPEQTNGVEEKIDGRKCEVSQQKPEFEKPLLRNDVTDGNSFSSKNETSKDYHDNYQNGEAENKNDSTVPGNSQRNHIPNGANVPMAENTFAVEKYEETNSENRKDQQQHVTIRPTLRSTLVCSCEQCVKQNEKLEQLKIKYFGSSFI